jgi:lysozyme family protein
VLAGRVFGPPGRSAAHRTTVRTSCRALRAMLMASEKCTRVWEAAHRQYGRAWETTVRCGKGDPTAAREMAAASWAVAAAWRQIAAATTLPWWTVAALESAAGAFESQAREYEQARRARGHDQGRDHPACDATHAGRSS